MRDSGLVLLTLRSGSSGYDNFDRPMRGFRSFVDTLLPIIKERTGLAFNELILPFHLRDKVGSDLFEDKTDLGFRQGSVRHVSDPATIDLSFDGSKLMVVDDEWSRMFEGKADELLVLRTYSLHKNWTFSDVTKCCNMSDFYPRDRMLWGNGFITNKFFMIEELICAIDLYSKRELSTKIATRRESAVS